MRHSTLQVFLFISALTFPGLSLPAVDFYDVEILVFQQLQDKGDVEELNIPSIRHFNLNLELQDLLDRTSAIHLEPAIEGYLTGPNQRIITSPDYEVLFYGRWSQTSSDRKSAPYIDINLPAVGGSHEVTGVFHLFATDLLYIDVLLRYQPTRQDPINQNSAPVKKSVGPYYFLKERRRIKFREIHFLDHPQFGVLLTVWPVKLPELPSPNKDTNPATNIDPSSVIPKSIELPDP
jgi:hypothetical protein